VDISTKIRHLNSYKWHVSNFIKIRSIILTDFFHRLKVKPLFGTSSINRTQQIRFITPLPPTPHHFSPDDEGRASLRNVVILSFKLCYVILIF
jgi:hypothetical protein